MLGSKQPMFIVWGPEQTTLYNDAYAKICGKRHPSALGQAFREIWFDIWEQLDPIVSDAYNGISTSMDDIELLMHRNGFPEETHFAFSYSPIRGCSGEVLGLFCPCVETTAQVMMQRRLERERGHMRHVFESALGAVAILSGPDHTFTFANSEYQTLVGHRAIIGETLANAMTEVVDQGFIELLDTVLATGETYTGRGVEVELQRTPNSPVEKRVVDFTYHAIRGPAGEAEGIFVQAIDITERADAERQQQLLNNELAHRMKNQLSLIQSIANQTFRSASDIHDARASLTKRISVLARSHDMLISDEAESASVGAILHEVMSLHGNPDDGTFRISGPADVTVGPRATLSLSLMLHELSTNAAKYGALSVETGYVTVSWRVGSTSTGDEFILEWEEIDGPPVTKPTHSGSGTRLLKAGVSNAQFCQVEVSYRPAGVHCMIRVDIAGLQS
ncbi:HWE histidine kinase domain-containing protein [Hoeflea sp.]|uniref:PAS domain-containing sensor histidine kinase n=1 Tax=Hoeflea sp. TaxID=1940281 RepID=UPI0025BE48FB|nr:HWE histidine kinase domain-containing protein [Hoeflea sp.]